MITDKSQKLNSTCLEFVLNKLSVTYPAIKINDIIPFTFCATDRERVQGVLYFGFLNGKGEVTNVSLFGSPLPFKNVNDSGAENSFQQIMLFDSVTGGVVAQFIGWRIQYDGETAQDSFYIIDADGTDLADFTSDLLVYYKP